MEQQEGDNKGAKKQKRYSVKEAAAVLGVDERNDDGRGKTLRIAYAIGCIAARLYADGKLPAAANDNTTDSVSEETAIEVPVGLLSGRAEHLCE